MRYAFLARLLSVLVLAIACLGAGASIGLAATTTAVHANYSYDRLAGLAPDLNSISPDWTGLGSALARASPRGVASSGAVQRCGIAAEEVTHLYRGRQRSGT
jgi:hypothetical protein